MPYKWSICLGLCIAAMYGQLVHAAVFHTSLDNGLTVLIEENHANPVVSVQVFVRTGSIYEQEYLGSGISHFFEHVLHGGATTKRSEAENHALLEAIGDNSNAYTTTDHTAYFINTTTEHWLTALDLLSDWMLNSIIEAPAFEREKGVVQRELEQGLDEPGRMLGQIAMETRFQVHPTRYPVIGYKEQVQKIARDDLVTYYQRMYAPNNMIVVVVGDVQTQAALQHVQQAFASGQRRSLPALSLPEEPPQIGKRTISKDMAIAQAHMSLSFATVSLTHPHLYALDVLSDILANGDSARLVQRIKEERQLVYGINSASITPAYAPGSLTVWATLAPDKLLQAEEAILQELYRLREELVSPQELAKAKKQKITEHVFAQQTVQGRARSLGLDMLSTYNPQFSELYVQRIQNVTAEDIRQVARQYFYDDTLLRAVVQPPAETTAAATTVTRESAAAVVKKVLANGMTLLLKRQPALPVVTIQAYFKAGVRVETPDTNGVSQLMATLLPKGTTTRSAEQIATAFDALGAELNVESGNNTFFVTATSLADDFFPVLEVYADMIQHPSFPEAELEKTRRLMLAEIAQQNDDWRQEVENVFRQTFFTASPYRFNTVGNAAAVQRLQRQDVVAFHQRYAVPANMVLAIVGDIDLNRTTAAVEQAFSQFTAPPAQFPAVAPEPRPTQPRRQVKTTQKQIAAIYIGFPGATITNVADRYALHILDGIMSGIQSPSGWLHNELRGRQLVYEVHALNWLGLEPGYFGIYAATQPPQVEEVIELILQQVEKARAGTISDEELASARQTAVIAMQLQHQTNEQVASDMALHELYGLGYDFRAQEQQRLSQVTKADVQRVAQAYLTHPTIVITTPNPAQK